MQTLFAISASKTSHKLQSCRARSAEPLGVGPRTRALKWSPPSSLRKRDPQRSSEVLFWPLGIHPQGGSLRASFLPSNHSSFHPPITAPRWGSPSNLLLKLGTKEEIREEKDVTQLPRSLHQLHHEAVLQKLPVLSRRGARPVS